eukprot:2166144-Prymnesium_polylepis.2
MLSTAVQESSDCVKPSQSCSPFRALVPPGAPLPPMIWSKLAFAAAAFQAEPSWNVTSERSVNEISYGVEGAATTAA